MEVFKLPDVFVVNASFPVLVLKLPFMLNNRALFPIAVLLLPVVLNSRVLLPIPELLAPVVLFLKLSFPIDVLLSPVVFLLPESNPTNVLVVMSLDLTSMLFVPLLAQKVDVAVRMPIVFNEIATVPLKDEVGVIISAVIAVAIGPEFPLVFIPLILTPP